ncbi:MAG: 50S ribosomal protein L28 [Rickettsiaceae bacterium]|nr:50S ribosomal protein L28 [Rickettsiaceae bacterium]
MSRICELTGTGVLSGNNVSHSQRKTRRRFLPNLQNVTLYSDVLGRGFKFRIATRAIRAVESKGGLDNFLLDAELDLISKKASEVRKMIKTKGEI